MSPDVAYSRLRGFLHYIAELTGKLKLARARKHCRFDKESFSAYNGPRKTCGNTYLVLSEKLVIVITLLAEIFLELSGAYCLLQRPFLRSFCRFSLFPFQARGHPTLLCSH